MNFPALQPLFEALPIERAMPALLPSRVAVEGLGAAERLAESLADEPALQAAVWLYVDDLDRSHTISQGIATREGAFLHGVMHRREGDFSNAKYWFRQSGGAPFTLEGYDPIRFVDGVAAARGTDPADLIEMQRREWLAIVELLGGQR